MKRNRISIVSDRWWFLPAAAFITAVSLYDTWLIVEFAEFIPHMEENPLGRWLLRVNGGNVSVLVRVKLAGTLLVLVSLMLLRQKWPPAVRPVTAAISMFQATLLSYLTLY